MVMLWPYMNALIGWTVRKQTITRSTAEDRTHVINCVLHYAKVW
jgi:hypothetical protein